MFGLCTALWIEGSAMLLGGEGLCWEVLGLGLGLGGGVLAVLGPAGAWKGGWSGLSKPCSSNNCKFARKTSMLARRKKDKTGWRMDEYGGYTNAESKNIINGGMSQGEKDKINKR